MYFSWRVFRFVLLQRVKKSKDRLSPLSRSFWTRNAPGKFFSGVKSLGQNLEIQNFQLPFVDLCTVVKIYYLMWALVEHFQLLGLISFLQLLSKALSSPTFLLFLFFWFYIASSTFFPFETLLPLLQNIHLKKWLNISCVRFYFTTSFVPFKAPIFRYVLLMELRFIRIHKKWRNK